MDAEQGAAGYHVEAAVLAEELEGRGDVGELLDFIEKQERPARNEGQGRSDAGDAGNHGARRIAVLDDALELGRFDEVDFNETPVVPAAEAADGFRLADLAGPLDQQGFPPGVAFPVREKAVECAFDVGHGNS